MIDAYMISNIQESLDLTDAQFVKLLPLVKKLQSDRQGFAVRRMETTQELRRVLKSGGATEARVADLLKTLKTIEAEEPAAVRKDLDAVDAALTPLQQAKFRVVQIEVEVKIRELMGQLRGPGVGPRGQGRNRQDGRRPDGPKHPEAPMPPDGPDPE